MRGLLLRSLQKVRREHAASIEEAGGDTLSALPGYLFEASPARRRIDCGKICRRSLNCSQIPQYHIPHKSTSYLYPDLNFTTTR